MNLPKELIGKSKSMIGGVYKIENTINGKFYIGSSNNLHRRFSDHLKELERKNHSNPKLQSSWNKYGKENFSFEILEYCPEKDVYDLEQTYLNKLNPFFNIAKTVGYPNTPRAGTPEAKARSLKNLESRKKSAWCNSKELHEIMSEKLKKRWENREYRKSRSEETKKLWGNKEYRNALSNAHKKIQDFDRKRIQRLRKAGIRIKDLMSYFGVARVTISRIVSES